MNHLLQTVFCTLKPSSIHGVGVFAIRDIPKGTQVIFEYERVETVELTEQEFESLPIEIQEEILPRTIFIKDEPLIFLDPNSAADFRSFMNHSDNPNTNGKVALRDIAKGEELTENYKDMGEWHRLTSEFMFGVI